MSDLNAYLTFNGSCAEAMRFYVDTLQGRMEAMLTMGESPLAAQLPPAAAGRIMHARAVINGRVLMASDAMPGQPSAGMSGFSLTLVYRSVPEATRIFTALAAGGTITMPIQKTFWAEAFGMLTDRFGTPWMVSTSEQTS